MTNHTVIVHMLNVLAPDTQLLDTQLLDALLLGVTAFATSTFAGITGLGGGMLLLASLPFFLPVQAIIPVHGVSQLASNASRSLLAFRAVAWQYFPAFFIGSLVGVLAAAPLIKWLDPQWVPVFIGGYILCHLWWPAFKRFVMRYENFYLIGAIQTGLNPIVGATGPLTTTLLLAKLKTREAIVATNGVMMSFSHIAKIILFALTGFAYGQYWKETVILTIGAIVGSYAGTVIRKRIDGKRFVKLLKGILTILAVRMLVTSFFALFNG